jgi:hypothetical protein
VSLLYLAAIVSLTLLGPGPFALDNLRRRRIRQNGVVVKS